MPPRHMPVLGINKNGLLYCEDAYRLLQKFSAHQFDAIITDPPYEILIANHAWDAKGLNYEYLAYHFHRVLKPTGSVFVFCSDIQFGEWYKVFSFLFPRLRKFAWHKTNPMGWIKGKFIESLEYGLHACNHQSYFNKAEHFHNYIESAACGGNERLKRAKKDGKSRGKGDKSEHPTQKPLAVFDYLISALTKPGDTILDPFAGLFTSAVSAKRLGRRYVCSEYYLQYFMAAHRRNI